MEATNLELKTDFNPTLKAEQPQHVTVLDERNEFQQSNLSLAARGGRILYLDKRNLSPGIQTLTDEKNQTVRIMVQPCFDKKIKSEIEKNLKSIPALEARIAKHKADYEKNMSEYRVLDADKSGELIRQYERDSKTAKLILPDRLAKFPAAWEMQINNLKSFRDSIKNIVDQVEQEIQAAETEGKSFLEKAQAETKQLLNDVAVKEPEIKKTGKK